MGVTVHRTVVMGVSMVMGVTFVDKRQFHGPYLWVVGMSGAEASPMIDGAIRTHK